MLITDYALIKYFINSNMQKNYRIPEFKFSQNIPIEELWLKCKYFTLSIRAYLHIIIFYTEYRQLNKE